MDPKAPHAKCENCPLRNAPCVYGEGPDKADLVLIGEAPGRNEIQQGRPFVGQAGQLLNKVLAAVGLPREEIYLTNTALCGGTTKTNEASLVFCRERLVAEVKAREPKVVVSMGNLPTGTFTGEFAGIMKRRGRAERSEELGCWLLPTLHPAAVLRRPRNFSDLVEDLRKAVRGARYGEGFGAQPFQYRVFDIEDLEDAHLLLQRLQHWNMHNMFGGRTYPPIMEEPVIVFDIETSGYLRHRDRILCMVLSWHPDKAAVFTEALLDHPDICWGLKNLMEGPAITWVGHSAKFDAAFLLGRYGFKPKIGFDTLLAHYATDERRGTHDLKVLCARLFDAPDWEGDIKQHLKKPSKDSYALLPKDALHRYSAYDGVFTYRLYEYLRAVLDADPDLRKLHDELLLPASNAFVEIEDYGVRIDQGFRAQLEMDYTKRVEQIKVRLAELAGRPEFNPNSTKQVAVYLYDELRLPTPMGRTTQVAALNLIKHMHEAPALVSEYRHAKKMLSTYIRAAREQADDNDRVHTSFLLHGTQTGRLSSRSPNLQNIPRESDLRDLFVASPGKVLLYADYSQMELRVLTVLSEDQYMIDTYRGGRDLHSELCDTIWGKGEWGTEERMIAKAVNFGVVYGRSAYSMAAEPELNMTLSDAKRYIARMFRQRPGVAEFVKRVRMQAVKEGVLTTRFRRRRRFGLVAPANIKDVQGQASNFPIQSTASDVTLMALLELHEVLPTGSHVLLTVHDSILIETPEEHLDQVAPFVKALMEDVPLQKLGDLIPWVVDVEVGHSWGSLQKWEG